MKETNLLILENAPIARDTYKLRLKGDLNHVEGPGSFVNIKVPGFFLRRPISICDCDKKESILTLVYRVFGKGTDKLRELEAGESLSVLTGLGRGFDLRLAGDHPLLVGGGVGTPPIYWLAKELIKKGCEVQVLLGASTASALFFKKEFLDIGAKLYIATEDGSLGFKGLVSDRMKDLNYSYIYACGPNPMLKAVHDKAKSLGEYSLTSRMGCGFGVCMGCSILTKDGSKRVCQEGPVFDGKEILWDDFL